MMRLQNESFAVDKDIFTGNKVNAPSEAPSLAVTILNSRHSLFEIEQFNTNLGAASQWLNSSESSMQSIVDSFKRAKVVAEQMATGTYDTSQRRSTASEVENILEQIISLSNTRVNGRYIFAGSNTENRPNTANILETFLGTGHSTQASAYEGVGGYGLEFAREDQGTLASLILGTSNTLGASLAAPLDFNTWITEQEASDSPSQGMIARNQAMVAYLSDLVSAQVGEELTWQGNIQGGQLEDRSNWILTVEGACTVQVGTDPAYAAANAQDLVNQINAAGSDYRAWLEGTEKVHIEPVSTGFFQVEEVNHSGNLTITRDETAGGQTFRTEGVVKVGGAGTVTIGADSYPPPPATSFNDAAQLVEMINADSTRDYFAYLEGDETVHVVSKGRGAFEITGATGEVTTKDTTTMQELLDQINSGMHAVGVLQISSTPADTDTIILGDKVWTWEEIKGSETPVTPEDHAEVLAQWISGQTDEFQASVVKSGSRPTVQITARAAGKAGNVALSASGAAILSSGALYGGLDPTELNPLTSTPEAEGPSTLWADSAQGHGTQASLVYSSGNYHLRLTRDTVGSDAVLSIDPSTNLGLTTPMAGIDFSPGLPQWQIDQIAGTGTSQTMTNWSTNLPSTTSPVSDRLGEVLSWTADPDDGAHTFRTRTTVEFSAGAGGGNTTTINVGGAAYTIGGADAAASAEELVDWVNSPAGLNDSNYFAYLEGDSTVKLMAKDGAPPITIQETQDTGGVMTIDQGAAASTSLDQLNNAINNGARAVGSLHFGGGVALPAATDTVTLGDQSWSWQEITGGELPATAEGFSQALANWVNQKSDKFTASATTGLTGSSVQFEARAVGKTGNVGLLATNINSGVDVTDTLVGGLDGTKTVTTGKIYGEGASNLRLSTNIQATVLKVDGEDVTLRLRWYDDYGKLRTQDATLKGSGNENSVEVLGMGGLKIYKDDQVWNEGAVLNLSIGHDQSNQDELSIIMANFDGQGADHRLSYNWNQEQIIGNHMVHSLLGVEALAKSNNAGTGSVHMAGAYNGLTSRDLNIDVISEGQAPADPPTFRVSWIGDDGERRSEEITVSGTGQANAVTIPDCNGVQFYIDQGEFEVGDGFYHRIAKDSVHVVDTLIQLEYQLAYGNGLEPQTAGQETLQALDFALKNLLDYVGEAGSKKDRVAVRESVLKDHDLFHSETLKDLQEVDLEEAFMELRQLQSTYDVTLKTISQVTQMSLVSLM
jgi:flagellin-like hook-associated protein FlgL